MQRFAFFHFRKEQNLAQCFANVEIYKISFWQKFSHKLKCFLKMNRIFAKLTEFGEYDSFIANIFVITNIFAKTYRYFMSSKHFHKTVHLFYMGVKNCCFFWKIFRNSQLRFIFACIFALVSSLTFSLLQSTKQGKEKALCDALKCCGHEELFPYYLSCNKCIVGKSSQLSVKGRNSVKQSPRHPLLCQQGSIKKRRKLSKKSKTLERHFIITD